MDKVYKYSEWLIVAVILLIIWGFSKSYFLLFPAFQGVLSVEHYHFALMAVWCAILFAQPLLIKYKKLEIHRILGKFTFFLVPLLLHSILLVIRADFHAKLSQIPYQQALGRLAIQLPDVAAFAFFYVLAIVYKKNTKYHLRFMLATALLMFGPAFFRILRDTFGLLPPIASSYTFIASDIICAVFLIYDIYKKQPFQPFLIILLTLLFEHLLFALRMTFVWQSFAEKLVSIFF